MRTTRLSRSRICPSSGWLALALFCAALASASAQAPAIPFSKGPYIQAPEPGVVTILWESLTNNAGLVRFGPGDRLDQTVGPILPRELQSLSNTTDAGPTKHTRTNCFYLFEAELRGLKPGALYSYSVELGKTKTAARQFRALDAGAEQVRFVAYGDTRSDPQAHSALARQFLGHAPDFILHTGDLVARGEDYDLWSREFFTPLAGVIDRVPLFSVIGNHEHDGTNYLRYFDLPGRKLWYSLDVGPVHVLALDFRFPKASQEQFKFARQDLSASRAPWKIVILHAPLFNIGGHGSGWGHESYLPLFYKTKVDLVLAGHSHMYERFRPIAPKGGAADWAIMHVTSGGGGANLHLALSHPALVAQETIHHYMVFEANRDVLRAKAIRVDGSLIDSFELTKPGGRQPTGYLAQVYPEESLDLFFEVAPGLGGRVAALPTNSAPADVMLNILPRKKSAPPAELEITLASESVRSYDLVGGPVRTTTPRFGHTNVLWVKVQARPGTKVTQNKSRELSPPLIFQAKVTAPEGETFAYGAKSALSTTAEREAKKRAAAASR